MEAAQADEIVDAITDMVNVRVGAVFEPDEAKKAEKMQAYLSQTLPTGLVRIFQKDYFCTIVKKTTQTRTVWRSCSLRGEVSSW